MIKKLIINTFVTMCIKFLSAGLKFLIIIYITNIFGAAQYGAYIYALSIFLLINLIFRYGFDIYIQKETARLILVKKTLKSSYLLINIIWFSVISILIVTLLIEILLYMFHSCIDNLRYKYLSLLIAFGFLYSIFWILSYYFRGLNKGKFSVFNMEIIFPIVQFIFIYFFHKLNLAPYKVLIYSFVIALFFSVLIYFIKIKREILKVILISKIKIFKLSFNNMKNSYTFLLISMSSMLLTWTDIYVISFFENNETLGIYSVVTKIGALMLFPASAATIFFSNKVVEFIYNKNFIALKKIFNMMTIILSIISINIFIIINYFSEYILNFFGQEFTSASVTLLIYTFGQMINATTGIFESMFLMSDLKKIFFKLILLMISFNVIFNIPLVYYFGINGAAISTSFVILINRVIQYFIIKRRFFSYV